MTIFRSGPLPDLPLLFASALLGATAGIGINLYNTCSSTGGFGKEATRVKPLQTYNIIVLVIAILLFIASWTPLILLMMGVPPS
jgi:hypothetical protein